MSLQGIFDPMVRAYFKNRGSGGTEFLYHVLSNPAQYGESVEMPDVGTFWKVSDYLPLNGKGNGVAGFACAGMVGTDSTSVLYGNIQADNGGSYHWVTEYEPELGFWTVSSESFGVMWCAMSQAYIDIAKEEAPELVIPGPGIYVSSLLHDENSESALGYVPWTLLLW